MAVVSDKETVGGRHCRALRRQPLYCQTPSWQHKDTVDTTADFGRRLCTFGHHLLGTQLGRPTRLGQCHTQASLPRVHRARDHWRLFGGFGKHRKARI